MGQRSSRQSVEKGERIIATESPTQRRPTGGALERLQALNLTNRSTFHRTPRPANIPERRRSILGILSRDKRQRDHPAVTSLPPTPDELPQTQQLPELLEHQAEQQRPDTPHIPNPTLDDSSEVSPGGRNGSLMIMAGIMPASSPVEELSDSHNHESSEPRAGHLNLDDSSSSDPQASSAMDSRLQSSIDVLAALLSMATAATATSLLTGSTDVLSTLSTESPSGPQISPARAQAAWETLEGLFYLRSNRQSLGPPHLELLRDLAIALLASSRVQRSNTNSAPSLPTSPPTSPPIDPANQTFPQNETHEHGSGIIRRDRPQLEAGSFERFLVDLNLNVRRSLREDYLHRGGQTGQQSDVQRLNWWRVYRFPRINVAPASPVPVRFTAPGRRPRTESPPSLPQAYPSNVNEPSVRADAGMSTPESIPLIPVVLVGLRAVASPSSTSASPTETSPTSTPSPIRTQSVPDDDPRESNRIMDDVDSISSSYVIIVLGGHYPPDHRYVSASGTEGSSELDQLWDLVELSPPKPATATADEIEKSGLSVFKACKISEMHVAANTVDKCLICLDDYTDDIELRLLSCNHAFHRDCVDRWFMEGQNSCPACRSQGIQR